MQFNLGSLNSGGLNVVGGGQSLAPKKIQGSSATNPNYANYQPQGSVLSATTTAGGNVKTSTTSPVPTGGSGTQIPTTGQPQPAQPNYDEEINNMYNSYMGALGSAEGAAQSGFNQDISNLEGEVSNLTGKATTEGENLLSDTQSEEDKFNATLQSALSEAVRAYNALKQQGMSRFGGASSAGGAVGELAQQEYFKQQGAVGQKATEGSMQFAKERGRIRQYVQQKVDDLQLYKTQALGELRKNLSDKLSEISMRKADIEANKTRDKLAALQSTIEQARQIQSADQQFRQSLALAAVSKMQEVEGRQFTPEEIKTTIDEFMGGAVTQVGASAPVASAGTVKKTTNAEDEFSGLV